MAKFQVYTYEVWGNKRDGFEVNNRFRGPEIEINLQAMPESWGEGEYASDTTILWTLKQEGILKKGCHYDSFAIEGEFEYTLYVNQTTASVGGYYPICELERMEDD